MGGGYFGQTYFGDYGYFNPGFPSVKEKGAGTDSVSLYKLPKILLIDKDKARAVVIDEVKRTDVIIEKNKVKEMDLLTPKD